MNALRREADAPGLSPEDRARALLSDENARGVAEGRKRAARALLAPPGPARATREAFAPLEDLTHNRRGGLPGSSPTEEKP